MIDLSSSVDDDNDNDKWWMCTVQDVGWLNIITTRLLALRKDDEERDERQHELNAKRAYHTIASSGCHEVVMTRLGHHCEANLVQDSVVGVKSSRIKP